MRRLHQINHITEDFSPTHTGVTEMVKQLTSFLSSQGLPTCILTAGKAGSALPQGVELREFPLVLGSKPWRYPKGMYAELARIGKLPGHVFHLHGVWMAPQWLAARVACRYQVPMVLTAHDMLSPWHWGDGHLRRLKKLIYWHILAYPGFRHCSLIHAITPRERDNLAVQFPGLPLEVIPNAIDLEEADKSLGALKSSAHTAATRYLLFVGRLHPKKRVDLLIAAFARACKGQALRLLIVGPDDSPGYTSRLKAQVRALRQEGRISFLGPVFGAEKWQLYKNAWAFCAPSSSEVVGLVNLEAAAAEVPVITTHETGLSDWEEGGGLLVHPRLEELTRALAQVLDWSESERGDRGRALRRLVEKRYSWKTVGPQWLELYTSLLQEQKTWSDRNSRSSR